MFADYTNLFYSHKDIKTLFHTVNTELVKVNHWFIANKLSLNAKRTNYTLFHKPSTKEDIPLKIPELVIGTKLIKRKRYTVFSPINGYSKRQTPLIRGKKIFSPSEFWSKSHKKLSKRRTGN